MTQSTERFPPSTAADAADVAGFSDDRSRTRTRGWLYGNRAASAASASIGGPTFAPDCPLDLEAENRL
jgi:hypothetical protein